MRKKMYGTMAVALTLLMLSGNVPAEEGGSTNETTLADTTTVTEITAMTETMPPETEPTSSTVVTETITAAEALLKIDGETLYKGMNRSYKDGYVPTAKDGKVQIILPLVGDTLKDEVVLSVNLGSTEDNPFVYGNYNQTVKKEKGIYLAELVIPLASNRINGTYPVVLNAAYHDMQGNLKEQPFTVYVTITDGRSGETTTAVVNTGPETVRRPELFISRCHISRQAANAGETFTVEMTVENIGNLQAKNVKLSYGSTSGMLLSTEQNNVQLLGNLSKEKTVEASFDMKICPEAAAGIQYFEVTLACGDAYGGEYTLTRSFSIQVEQPAELQYDEPSLNQYVTAGDTFTLPANVFNTGKSVLRDVRVSLEGNGLFPSSSIFLGDIQPGEAGYGQMNVFVGMLTDPEGNGYYGETLASYRISYTDAAGISHEVNKELKTVIREPVIEPTPTPNPEQVKKEQAEGNWWISALAAFAILAVLISWIVTTRVIRAFRMGKHSER